MPPDGHNFITNIMNLSRIIKTPLLRLLAAVMALSVALPSMAQTQSEDLHEALVVTLRNGSTDIYFLSERPEVVFNGAVCRIESSELSADYQMAEVEKTEFKLEKRGGISDVEASGFGIDLTDPAKAVVSGMEPGSWVRLYSIDGSVVASVNAGGDGQAVIELEALSPAVYIILTQ